MDFLVEGIVRCLAAMSPITVSVVEARRCDDSLMTNNDNAARQAIGNAKALAPKRLTVVNHMARP